MTRDTDGGMYCYPLLDAIVHLYLPSIFIDAHSIVRVTRDKESGVRTKVTDSLAH